MTKLIPIGDKSINISSDMGKLWLQIFANRGSLGIELTPEQAKQIASELFYRARRADKLVAGRA